MRDTSKQAFNNLDAHAMYLRDSDQV